MKIRKVVFTKETIYAESGADAGRATTRAAGIVVIDNPHAGRFDPDLSDLFDAGADIAQRLMPELVRLLPERPIAYGKAAIVGVRGEMEHGAAILHPKMGKPVRAAVGGGEAIIPSNCKVAAAGAPVDVPLGHKDNVWSFDEIDTLTLTVADAPRPDEILVAIAVSDGGRVHARVGKGRTT